ncbi:hypothetical protein ASPBRDRAFT_201254 [Aspergillus brasiliensis CBS 101740]|uniref:AB hydrolase-1 domain-containing protein n=1 Tax=Aspergillus brasiliensis (strain CBS 101740 / IMI 381727 / IBT 21946) TaxID=767769 RepID=A0A1L9U390_ASPBC|nr:hypothetical protein ASPBRDRAFT_201254 [Aspergillus brasiliensis CBS 101740]
MSYFNHDDVKLFYILDGPKNGPTVLCLHGWGCDLHDWNFQIEYLHQLGFQTVAIDHRGHGRSSIPSDLQTLRPETFADDAVSLLNHLGISQCVVMGHSMGTVIASALAIKNPERVKALILSDPVYNLPREKVTALTHIDGSDASVRAAEMFKQTFYTPDTPHWLTSWHTRRVLGTPPAVVSHTLKGIFRMDDSLGVKENALEAFKKRKVPRLVICASESAATVDRALPVMEGDQIIIMKDSSHWPHHQEAVTFNEEVGKWLVQLGLVSG